VYQLPRQGRRLRPPGAGRADGLHDACGGREGDQAVLEGSHAAAQGDRPRHRGMSDHSPGTDAGRGAAPVVPGTNDVRRGSSAGVGPGGARGVPGAQGNIVTCPQPPGRPETFRSARRPGPPSPSGPPPRSAPSFLDFERCRSTAVCAAIARTNAPRQGTDTKRSWHPYQGRHRRPAQARWKNS